MSKIKIERCMDADEGQLLTSDDTQQDASRGGIKWALRGWSVQPHPKRVLA